MFSFYKNRFKCLILSLVVILAGLVCLGVFGLKLDIQFKGGSILKYTYEGELDLNAAKPVIETALNQQVTLQVTKDLATKKNVHFR